jgi:hypothetical protein
MSAELATIREKPPAGIAPPPLGCMYEASIGFAPTSCSNSAAGSDDDEEEEAEPLEADGALLLLLSLPFEAVAMPLRWWCSSRRAVGVTDARGMTPTGSSAGKARLAATADARRRHMSVVPDPTDRRNEHSDMSYCAVIISNPKCTTLPGSRLSLARLQGWAIAHHGRPQHTPHCRCRVGWQRTPKPPRPSVDLATPAGARERVRQPPAPRCLLPPAGHASLPPSPFRLRLDLSSALPSGSGALRTFRRRHQMAPGARWWAIVRTASLLPTSLFLPFASVQSRPSTLAQGPSRSHTQRLFARYTHAESKYTGQGSRTLGQVHDASRQRSDHCAVFFVSHNGLSDTPSV